MAVERLAWDNSEVLESNRANLVKQLRRELHSYEARYELRSEQIEAELAAGHLRDTAEVCAWVIAYDTYGALTRERQAAFPSARS